MKTNIDIDIANINIKLSNMLIRIPDSDLTREDFIIPQDLLNP